MTIRFPNDPLEIALRGSIQRMRNEHDANRALAWPRDNAGRFLPAGVPRGLQPWLTYQRRSLRA